MIRRRPRCPRAAVAIIAICLGCRGGTIASWFGGDKQPEAPTSGWGKASARVASSASSSDADESSDPVSTLTINGETITAEDVLKPLKRDLETRAGSMPDSQYRRYAREAIEARVRAQARDALLYHEASKNLTDKEREQIGEFADQRIRDRVNTEFAGRQTRYEQALANEGLAISDDRERVTRELIIARWVRMTVTPNIADPTREQLWQIFETYKGNFDRPARRRMQLIEISVIAQLPPDVAAPSEQQLSDARTAARRKAESARQAIIDGRNFADVAREYSDGLHARDGGDWGWITRGSVREKWEPAVDALYALAEAGTPSDIVETADASFIVQAAEIDEGYEPDFESLQPELVERYRNAQFNLLVDQWVGKLQEQANIRPRNVNRFLAAVVRDAPAPVSASSP